MKVRETAHGSELIEFDSLIQYLQAGFSWLEPCDVQKMAEKLLPQAGGSS